MKRHNVWRKNLRRQSVGRKVWRKEPAPEMTKNIFCGRKDVSVRHRTAPVRREGCGKQERPVPQDPDKICPWRIADGRISAAVFRYRRDWTEYIQRSCFRIDFPWKSGFRHGSARRQSRGWEHPDRIFEKSAFPLYFISFGGGAGLFFRGKNPTSRNHFC